MKSERISAGHKPLCWIYCALLAAAGYAQSASVDATFNVNINGPVTSLAAQPDGKVLVGGMFTEIDGVARPFLARLNADGSPDASFNPPAGPGQFINHVEAQSSKILVSGGDGIRQFTSDGALDWHYPMYVTTFVVDAQGGVVFGGRFSRVDNQYHRNLARLTAAGVLDTAFAPEIGCCAGDGVDSLLIANGRILVGGVFQTVNSKHAAQNIARINLDGSFDATFAGEAEPLVLAMAATPEGSVYRVSEQSLARHLPNGALDDGFTAQAPAGFDERFLAVAAHGDGVIVGGNFTFTTGGSRTHLARFTADGSLDASFNAQPNGTVRAIVVQGDGNVLIAGDFTEVDGQPHAGVARIASADPSQNAPALTVARLAGGVVLSWPAIASNARLEFRALNASTWTPVGIVPAIIDGRCCITNALSGPGRIYRLVRP